MLERPVFFAHGHAGLSLLSLFLLPAKEGRKVAITDDEPTLTLTSGYPA